MKWRVAWWLLAVAAVLLLIFDSTNFFASPRWRLWTWWTSSVCSVLLGGAYVLRYYRRTARRHRAGLLIGAPLLVFGAAWLLLGSALPHWYTVILGERVSYTAQLRAKYVPGGRVCRYRIHGEAFAASLGGYYCAGKEEFEKLPGEGRMRIRGQRSWFGLNATQVLPGSAPQ